jgi:hypothetical protein
LTPEELIKSKMTNKYKEGDVVYALRNANQKLVVRHRIDKVYYCKVKDDPKKELVYFERDLFLVNYN